MKLRVEIGKRIKKLRKEKKFSQSFVAEKLSISQAAYSLIENSQNGIVAEHILKLSDIYDVTTDFLLKGDTLLVRMSPENGFIPLIKAAAQASFAKNFQKDELFENYDWYRIPGFEASRDQKMFEVQGENMVPTVLPGDVLICQIQNKIDYILDGTLVLIITREAVLVKRLRMDKDSRIFLLENDNPNEEKREERIKKSEINQIMVVKGKISSVLIPHHELASKGKIKAMEEAIELLQKELYKMNKKVRSLERN